MRNKKPSVSVEDGYEGEVIMHIPDSNGHELSVVTSVDTAKQLLFTLSSFLEDAERAKEVNQNWRILCPVHESQPLITYKEGRHGCLKCYEEGKLNKN